MKYYANIYKHRAEIINYLIYHEYINGKIKLSTLSGKLDAVATMIMFHNKDDKSIQRDANNIFAYSKTLQHADKAVKHSNNVLTDKDYEHYVPQSDLVMARKQLEDSFYQMNFGKHKDRKGNETLTGHPDSKQAWFKHCQYLFLAVNTLIPPLRREFMEMQYVESEGLSLIHI